MQVRAQTLANRLARTLAIGVALFGMAPAASAVTIDWTPVGNPGVACDTQSQGCFGAVASAYNIGTYEVTNAQYAEFLNAVAAVGQLDPNALYSTSMGSGFGGITRTAVGLNYSYAAIALREDMPVNFVSFYDTLRFANWLNNGQGAGSTETGAYTLLGAATPINGTTVTRNAGATIFLPSEDEWYKAAYYNALSASYFDYPAGSDTQTTCTAPAAAANSANCDAGGADLSDPDVDNLTIAGSFTGSASPYGTSDQGGNVSEWNEAIISVSNRGTRGGSFFFSAALLSASTRFVTNPASEFVDTGFRVASIPEPATGLLVMAGLLGLACRRKRST